MVQLNHLGKITNSCSPDFLFTISVSKALFLNKMVKLAIVFNSQNCVGNSETISSPEPQLSFENAFEFGKSHY